ncbi:MAG: TrmH family RNA methyltransferase [Patescibacteria group bacterium]
MTKTGLPQIVLVLDNIRSAHNVGSLFRTADAVGVEKLFLCGTTPAPIDRFGRERSDVAKVALGAEKNIAYESVASTHEAVLKLKNDGYQIIAIEQSPQSVDYKKVVPTFPTAFILGTEVTGLSEEVLKLADVVAKIKMAGKKESLNVVVAAGVTLFRILGK